MRHRILPIAGLLAVMLLATACFGPQQQAQTPPTTQATAPGKGEPTGAAGAAGAVANLDGVQSATVQIVAQGSFVDPEVGLQLNAAGAGSGFIIDPSGIAVTNNHVVTGSALLQVFVGGETEPRNAQVLGVSECSDLAVIDIDGDGYPFLNWHSGDVNTGLDVYAAGYPLGDPEFTLTRGIISKAQAEGETIWASVDRVVEHDATINPGNSGGPLVTADGQVVGVNFASAPDVNQYFAIARAEAEPIIEQLRNGQDVTSIGVNGVAVSDGADLSGVWVASVESGSPASNAGIQGGDIITRLENLVLATDGTMADYCDILRSRQPTDVLAVEVLRFASSQVLAGELNGQALEESFSFAQEFGDEMSDDSGAAGTSYSGYRSVTDDTGAITMDVPNEWGQVDGSAWVVDGQTVGAAISAAADLNAFYSEWTESGVFFGASRSLASSTNEAALLDRVRNEFNFDACVYDGRQPYEDPAYTGEFDLYSDCGGEGVIYIVLAAVPPDRSFIINVQVQLVTDADLDALDQILNTFFVVGNL